MLPPSFSRPSPFMRRLVPILFTLFFCSTGALAAPASEDSIKELLAVSQAQKLVDSVRGQLDTMMTSAVQTALKGKAPDPAEQRAIDRMRQRMSALYQNELAWEKLEPLYVRLYQESFTDEEIAGMTAFYRTPAGQAVINKMPMLMQKTMAEMQRTTSEVTPKVVRIQMEFLQELKAAASSASKPNKPI